MSLSGSCMSYRGHGEKKLGRKQYNTSVATALQQEREQDKTTTTKEKESLCENFKINLGN